MKKILFVAVLAVASVMAYAQPRAIGGRLGAFEGVSYQHAIGESNMIEVELGLGFGGHNSFPVDDVHYTFHAPNLQLAATYDWIDPFNAKFPWEHKGEWHWYMGVGAAAGYGWGNGTVSARYKGEHESYGLNHTYNWGFVAAAGRVGVEYDFWFPLQLSVDWRPTMGVGLMDDKRVFGEKDVRGAFYWEMYDICLGVRYKF